MKILSITWKDLLIQFKDRGVTIQLLLLPLLFVIVFGGALSEIGKSSIDDTRIALPVVNLDNGDVAQTLINGIDTAGGVQIEVLEQAEAEAMLDENQISHVLIIPHQMSSDIAARQPVTLRLVNHADADLEQTEALRLVIEGVARDISLEIQILDALQQMGEMQANAPSEYRDAFSVERMQAQAQAQFVNAQTQPLVSVTQKVPGRDEEYEQDLGIGDVIVPGITVLFVFLTAQTAARSIYDEKKVGSFRRLLAAPMSKAAILLGKMLPNLVTGLIQTAVIFGFGVCGMRAMGLPAASLGSDPLGVLLVVALMALCSSALGMFIAAIASTENQIGGLSTLLLWGMGILGGAFIPLFLLERFLGWVPKVVPHYWANHALISLMVRGGNLVDVVPDCAMLLGFTALFFVIGLWRFEFD